MKFPFPSVSAVVSVLSLSAIPAVDAASYATGVVHYDAGTGAAAGYQDASNALGEPSRSTASSAFTSPVDPFNPAWKNTQLVSIGKGGSLTLAVDGGVRDDVSHAFGVDFILFGNNGFQVSDYNVPQHNWTTDGSLFTFDTPGATTVSVSANGTDFYRLSPPAGLSATVDGLFPTDGEGSFVLPVDPHLTAGAFAGRDLAGIRALYAGSAGGAGFDLAWAVNPDGSPAGLAEARYVRIDVLDGKVEVDGLAVVPEPSAVILSLAGIGILAFRRLRNSRVA